MNKPDRVPDHVIEVSQVHGLARLVEAERKSDRKAGTIRRYLFVRTLHVLEVVREDVNQFDSSDSLHQAWRTTAARFPLSSAARSTAWKIATQARYA